MADLNFSRRHFILGAGLTALAASSRAVYSLAGQRKLGVALVGLGYYSRDLLAPALQLTRHCELRGIVTGSLEKIPVWQKQYGIKDSNVYNYLNMHTMADNPDIDIVYVVVPTALHEKYSLIAANAGKHVWCEKPMAMTPEECQTIIDTCNKNKVRLSVGYRMQHEPNTQTVMQYAATKPYAKIIKVSAFAGYGGSGGPPDYWRMRRDMGGGALYDMGVYAINASRYATGEEPISISARHEKSHPEIFREVDETTYFTLEFPSGAMAEGMGSVVMDKNSLQVDCGKGWYTLRPMSSYVDVTGETSDGVKLNKFIANQQAAQMDNDALAIINDTAVLVPGEEGLRDIRIVRAAFESVEKGKAIRL